MSAILHFAGHHIEANYFQLLGLNGAALIVAYVTAYVGCHRPAKWIVWGFLGLNTPVVLFLLGSVIHEAFKVSARQGAERSAFLSILIWALLWLMLEFLAFVAAWWRLRQRAHTLPPSGKE